MAQQPPANNQDWSVPYYLKGFVNLPIIVAFIAVAAVIIYRATVSQFVLDNIVALILALNILQIPADEIVVSTFTKPNPNILKVTTAMPLVAGFVLLTAFIIFQATTIDFVLQGIVAIMAAMGVIAGPTYKIVRAVNRAQGEDAT